ncbi:MAG TPA: Na+/H+ antiporter subunit E [Hyphomicrobiales bacterium]|nr:Na+/H+ antiporter subunit E [Hyphomicrobiales bacterium]
MMRWLPYPYISLTLLVAWLLLNQSLAPGQWLLGLIFGLLGPLLLRQLDIPPMRLRRPTAIARLAGAFFMDMVRSNYKVAQVVLRNPPGRKPGFVQIPLALRSHYGLAVLACIITATPGTSWVSHNPDDGILVIHVLDLADDDDWGMILKTRYECLLMEIFE